MFPLEARKFIMEIVAAKWRETLRAAMETR
jgi:hypothetical protein